MILLGSTPGSPTMGKTGYKEMLRNRIPVYVDIALKWCHSKERWLNLVYNTQINIFVDKQERYNAIRIVLGLSSKNRSFDFEQSLDWEYLSEDDKLILNPVKGWISWFKNYFLYLDNKYKTNLSLGMTDEETIEEWCSDSGLLKTVDTSIRRKLATFVLNYLKN